MHKEADSKIYDYIVEHEKLPEDIDILLTTQKIVIGVNIRYDADNPRKFLAFTLDKQPGFNHYKIRQFEGRFRDREHLEGLYIICSTTEQEIKKINLDYLYWKKIEKLKVQTQELRKEIENGDLIDWEYYHISEDTKESKYFILNDDGNYSVNELAIREFVMKQEIKQSTPEHFYPDAIFSRA